MKCPFCPDMILVKRDLDQGSITVKYCPKCKGAWFEKGKLTAAFNAQKIFEVDSIEEFTVPPDALALKHANCPACDKPLRSFLYPKTFISIEVCESCLGVWLDQGELEAISDEVRLPHPLSSMLTKSLVSREHRVSSEVQGTKGSLLRFIDNAIEALTKF